MRFVEDCAERNSSTIYDMKDKTYMILAFEMDFMIKEREPKWHWKYQALEWLRDNGFEMSKSIVDYNIHVVFPRSEKTLQFIKKFLEPIVNHALSKDEIKKIPGIYGVEY